MRWVLCEDAILTPVFGGVGVGDDVSRLVRLMGEAIPRTLARAAGGEAEVGKGHVLALSGEPAADCNMLVVAPVPDAGHCFRRGLEKRQNAGCRSLPCWRRR